MKFKKGNTLGGRKKGSTNRNKVLINSLIDYLIDGGFSKFKKELDNLNGEEYVKTIMQLIKISTPQKQSDKIRAEEYLTKIINSKIKK